MSLNNAIALSAPLVRSSLIVASFTGSYFCYLSLSLASSALVVFVIRPFAFFDAKKSL